MTEARYTDGTYLAENPTWHAEDAPWKARQIAGMLHAHGLAPETVCDVGCGSGDLLTELREHLPADARLTGYDVAPDAIDLARARRPNGVSFHVGQPPSDTTFDLLLLVDVFEHVEDCFGFLRELRGLGRREILHIPLDLSAQNVLRRRPLMNKRRKVGHLHYFTKDTALATLEETGREIVDWSYTAHGLELPPRSRRARVTRVTRRLLDRVSRDWTARALGGYSLLVLTR